MIPAALVSTRFWGGIATLVVPVILVLTLFPDWGLVPLDRWALTVLAVALLALGFCLRRGAAEFGALAFVFITGAGAQLYMTEPLWFPTLRLRPQGLRDGIMIALMALEVAVAVAILRRTSPSALLDEAVRRFGAGRIAVLLAVSFAFTVPVTFYVDRGAMGAYLAHVVVGAVLILLHMTVLLAMAWVKSPVSGLHRVSPVAHAMLAVLASLALGIFALETIPHVEDEVAYVFQARTLGGGALSTPAPPEAAQAGLDYYLLEVKDGRWFSATLPGWPAALAAAIIAGVPWLLNPLLAGFSVLMAYQITVRMAGRDEADIVAMMMAFSPWLMAAAATMMPHTLTLALTLLAWWLVLGTREATRRGGMSLLIAGLAMGWIFCTRPLDGLILGGLTGLWVLFWQAGSLRRALPYAVGCILAGSLLLVFNWHLAGSPLTLPLSAYVDRIWAPGANAFGFGPDIGPENQWGALDLWRGHSPAEAALNTINLFSSLQLEFMGWPVGSIILLIGFFLWRRGRSRFDLAMLLLLGTVILVMALYWYADIYYVGPRYWFVAVFPMFYLSARGYVAIRDRLPASGGQGGLRFEAMLWLLCAFGLLVFTPWRGVAKYHEYNGFYADIRDAAAAETFGSDIVIFDGPGDEGAALFLNDPWLRPDRPLFLYDDGALDADALAEAFPGRKITRFTRNPAPGDPDGEE